MIDLVAQPVPARELLGDDDVRQSGVAPGAVLELVCEP